MENLIFVREAIEVNSEECVGIEISRLKSIKDDLQELQEYKFLETHFGCPIKVMYTAVTAGVWIRDSRSDELHYAVVTELYKSEERDIEKWYLRCNIKNSNACYLVLLESYKYTWWLRKDKSK